MGQGHDVEQGGFDGLRPAVGQEDGLFEMCTHHDCLPEFAAAFRHEIITSSCSEAVMNVLTQVSDYKCSPQEIDLYPKSRENQAVYLGEAYYGGVLFPDE